MSDRGTLTNAARALADQLRTMLYSESLHLNDRWPLISSDTDGWYVEIGTWRNRPSIQLWLDKWLGMDDRYFWVGFTAFTQEKMASVDGLPAPVKLRTKPSVSALRSRAFYEVPGWFFYGRYCARSEWNVRHAAEFIETVVKNTEDETPFNDIERLQNNSKLKPTTKKRLIDSRLGQGRFREEVMRRWHRACAVTGCRLKQILRASHIKPWSRSNSREQLDPANGILLLANIDALFDARLVTFDDDGKMIISQRIDHKNRKELGIPANLRRKPDARERRYLAEHRRVFRST